VTLNRAAAEAMSALGSAVHAATDVTGFGLLGHLRNLVLASGTGAVVALSQVPVLDAAWRYVAEDLVPGGTHANRRFLLGLPDGPRWVDTSAVDEAAELVLSDAQTSGGLLIAVGPEHAAALVDELRARGVEARQIGHLTEPLAGDPWIRVHV
jgi:selenide,water dikinase